MEEPNVVKVAAAKAACAWAAKHIMDLEKEEVAALINETNILISECASSVSKDTYRALWLSYTKLKDAYFGS